jgi:diguanylate cyclase (GGDEF)-like protein
MPARPATVTPEKPHLLVADDSRVIRAAVAKILGADFALQEAEDGESAWQQLQRDEKIQVVVTDIEMPKLDGYALICRVRGAETPRIRELPIVVITGAEDETTRARAFACGATDFIVKPLDAVQLLARTRAHAHLDETTRKLSEAEMALDEQSATDSLTPLNSRRYFLQRGVQDLAYAKRHGSELSVIRLDIDNFRVLYDTHGNEVCDRLFARIAQCITESIRTEDTAARLRGAQFAVIAPAAGRMEAAVVCERIRHAVAAAPFAHEKLSLPVTVSLGLATLGREPGDDFETLIKSAEQSLTLAKAGGGNRLGVSYQEELQPPDEAVLEEPDMETALKMLESGDGGKLVPYLPDLATRLIPLLELCNRNLDLDIDFAIGSMKDKLSNMK